MAVSPFELLGALNQQLGQFLPDMAKSAQDDLHLQAKASLSSLISRLDLVTREEFDVQAEVLRRTREKLDLLEKRVAELEASLNAE